MFKSLLVILDRIRRVLSFEVCLYEKSLILCTKTVLFSNAEDEVDKVNEWSVSGEVSCGVRLADRNSKLCNSMHNLLLCTSSSP